MHHERRFKTELYEDLLAIWDDDGHGADVFFDPDTGAIGEIVDWDDGQGLLANGVQMEDVIAGAKVAIRETLKGSLPCC